MLSGTLLSGPPVRSVSLQIPCRPVPLRCLAPAVDLENPSASDEKKLQTFDRGQAPRLMGECL